MPKKAMTIYFAGSIRGGRQDQALYLELIDHLSNYGTVLTEHVGAASLTEKGEQDPVDQYIYTRDIEWLSSADVVVAEVTTPSLGVGYELAYAEKLGKKVLCLYREQDDKRLSAMISGNDFFTIKFYKDAEEGKKCIDKFMD